MTRVTPRSPIRAVRPVAAAVAAVVGAALLPWAALSPAAAGTSGAETYAVPSSGSFELSGLGFGHGIGMSQFGAEGMGREGKGYRDILAFYYPGTTMQTEPTDHAIRVGLSGMTRREEGTTTVTAVPRTGLTARAGGSDVALPAKVGGEAATAYRVLRGSRGLVVRAYGASSSAKVVGPVSGPVTFRTADRLGKSKVTVLTSGSSARTYHGRVVVSRTSSGLRVVDDLLLEQYLRAVVSLEVPGSWTSAALQAQAVAARSYALMVQQEARAAHQPYDICDTTSCQAFGSIATESTNEVAAVKATAGEYLASNGEPAFTQFSSADGGYTVAGSQSYLVAQPDPYDGVVPASENWGHSWTRTVTAASIQTAWPSIGTLQSLKVVARDGNGQWGGRVLSVALVGSAGTESVTGDEFRWTLGLKSTWWTVTNSGTTSTKAPPGSVAGKSLDRAVKVTWAKPRTGLKVQGYRVTLQPGDVTKRLAADQRAARFEGLVNGVGYRARVVAVYSGGRSDGRRTKTLVPTSPESYFRPVRSSQVWAGKDVASIADGGAVSLTVAGAGSVPLAGTRAVLVRVRTSSAHPGSTLAWRTGSSGDRLTAATFQAHQPTTGAISVPVSKDGSITVGTTVAVRRLSVDVVGYYTASGVKSWAFHGTPATRLADSAAGVGMPQGRISAKQTTWVKAEGRVGLPASGVRAVLVNVTLVKPSDDAQLSMASPGDPFESGLAVRTASGTLGAATAVVRLDDRGRLPLRLSAGRAGVVVDVLGWFGRHGGSAQGRFRTSNALLLDPSRDGPMGDGEVAQLTVAGVGKVPPGARAVLLLVRAFGATTQGQVSLRPVGADVPRRACVLFDDRGPTRNLVAVPVGTGGQVEVAVSGDAADVSVRVVGWYS